MALGRILILTGLAASLTPRAAAGKWDSPPPSLPQALAAADLVFEGRPIARHARADEDGLPGWDYVFEVDRHWKGDFRPRQLVYARFDSCSRSNFRRGASVVVFASRGSTGYLSEPRLSKAATIKALGPPVQEAGPVPTPIVDMALFDHGRSWETPAPRPAPWSWHSARDVALIVVGFALALVPVLRARRRAARVSRDARGDAS